MGEPQSESASDLCQVPKPVLENKEVEGCKEMRDSKTYTDKRGYLRFRDSNKLVHRWVMEKKLDRPLHEDELVHHINGNKKDNKPDNLELMTRKEHFKEHVVPVIEARRENQIIKAIFSGFAFFGALLFIGGLIIRNKLEMWYIGLLF